MDLFLEMDSVATSNQLVSSPGQTLAACGYVNCCKDAPEMERIDTRLGASSRGFLLELTGRVDWRDGVMPKSSAAPAERLMSPIT